MNITDQLADALRALLNRNSWDNRMSAAEALSDYDRQQTVKEVVVLSASEYRASMRGLAGYHPLSNDEE